MSLMVLAIIILVLIALTYKMFKLMNKYDSENNYRLTLKYARLCICMGIISLMLLVFSWSVTVSMMYK